MRLFLWREDVRERGGGRGGSRREKGVVDGYSPYDAGRIDPRVEDARREQRAFEASALCRPDGPVSR